MKDVKDLKKGLLHNLFPKRFIDRAIKRFLDSKEGSELNTNKNILENNEKVMLKIIWGEKNRLFKMKVQKHGQRNTNMK